MYYVYFQPEYPLLTVDGYIARTENSPPLWGLATTLQSVNLQALESMAWLLSTMKVEWKFSTFDNEHLVSKAFKISLFVCTTVAF